MRVEVKRYTEELREQWDNLVAASVNGTFLHTRSFFDHNPQNASDDCSFVFYKKSKPVAVLPAVIYEREGLLTLHSHLRCTYGGFVVNTEVGVGEALDMVALLTEQAKALGVKKLIIRNAFRIFQNNVCDETDYAMWYHGFKILAREAELAIQLKEKTAIERLYNDATMRSIKKGKKSLTVAESEDFESYWHMLTANLAAKHNVKPTHSYAQFCTLLDKVGRQHIKLFVASFEGKMAGGIVVFIVNGMALHAQYIASDLAYQEYRPLNLVIDYLNEWGFKEGYKYLNLGTANEDSGRVLNEGLLRFKEGFGARSTLRETMILEL